jgi:hypothetical protein
VKPSSLPSRRRRLPARRNRPRARLHAVAAPTDWAALTEAILARCDGLCEACGLTLPARWTEWDRHHRQTREYGDDTLPNLVGVHSDCHVVAPHAIHQRPAWARSRGLIVPSWSTPAATGLWLPDGRLVRLTPEGPYELIMEGEAGG